MSTRDWVQATIGLTVMAIMIVIWFVGLWTLVFEWDW